ncbi:MAG: N-acetylmuramoyl-L-alanine amidase [Clostridia bacterium]|nr:N-acetylmuramoyl-L-alanine amidase [Clostridia bacterium]
MEKYTVTLDAGHFGNYNPSTVLKGYWESRRMWILCEMLAEELVKYGFNVNKTRDDEETDLEVEQRGMKAKGSELFISLHSNACDTPSVDYVCVFGAYDNKNDSWELGGRLAAAVSELMGCSGGYVKTRIGSRGEYYGVMRGARNAGCPLYYIIEHSFHTNLRASQWLMEDANLRSLARTEAAIIAAHFGLLHAAGQVKGDVNGNGVLDGRDVAMIKRAVLGTLTLSDEQRAAADADGDGKLTAKDYAMAKRAFLGNYRL